MAQSVGRPTLDFSSGHDLMGHEIEPCAALMAQILLEILSPPLSAPPLLVFSVSQNK